MIHLFLESKEGYTMNCKKCFALFCSVLLCIIAVSGCVTPGTKATVSSGQGGPSISEAQAVAYNGPQARIAVARFKDKTGKGWWSGRIGTSREI